MTPSADHPFRSAAAKATYLAHYDAVAAQWPLPATCTTVATSYGQTFVRISGPADAPPLVLLPGAGTCSLMWRLNIAALSSAYRTYALDSLINTGCVGRSVPTRAIPSADDATTWLDEVVDGLGLTTNINLLGVSYGGWLASQYALRFPDRLHKVVAVAPAGTILPFRGAYLARVIALSMLPRRWMYQRFLRWSFPTLARTDPQLFAALVDESVAVACCFAPPRPREVPRLTTISDADFRRIQHLMLVVIGEHEVLYSAEKALQRLRACAPHIQAERIPHAGHDLLLVQPEVVNRTIMAFLSESRGTDGGELRSASHAAS